MKEERNFLGEVVVNVKIFRSGKEIGMCKERGEGCVVVYLRDEGRGLWEENEEIKIRRCYSRVFLF